MARLIKLVAAMISSLYNESLHGIEPIPDESSAIDADVLHRAYDDLAATFPTIQELAAMLFLRRNQRID